MQSITNQNRFSHVPNVEIPRSKFNRSHGFKTTFDAGYLVPIFIDEVLPGDTFKLNATGFARLSTPSFPIMDNMFLDTFFFAVPNRLIWSNWQRFMGERVDPGDSIAYTVPVIDDLNNASNETLYDYLGIPTQVAAAFEFSALPLRAYNLIWNEWFRDENLQDQVANNRGDGPDDAADYALLRRGKRHDYFTSALPWLQKGDAVSLPLGTTADVFSDAEAGGRIGVYSTQISDHCCMDTDGTDGGELEIKQGVTGSAEPGRLQVDLTNATSATINELRQAVQVQRLLERDARSGTRYTEIIQSHFGVTSPDARLQRPEYLGGGTTPVNISPIARTDSSPGALGAIGTTFFKNHGFIKSFTEHCIVIGLACVRADLTYQEGLDRMWSRQTRFDYYWPTLAHLGEQSILNKEIYLDAASIGDTSFEDVFGYQERYAEYRYKNSKITGKLRSNDAASLDAWHLGIEFGTTPTLDDTFIQDNPPVDRVIVTPAEPHFIYDSFVALECTRPMPVYSVPGLIDHF